MDAAMICVKLPSLVNAARRAIHYNVNGWAPTAADAAGGVPKPGPGL